MKQDKNRKKGQAFVTSIEQAEFTFRTLFKDYNEKQLTDGVLLWLSKMKDKTVMKTFLSLPELFEEYDVEDFLKSKVDLPGFTDKGNTRVVGLAACMLYLITTCWGLFGKKIHQQEDLDFSFPLEEIDIIQDVLAHISLEEFQAEFSVSIMTIIGEQYHNKFLEKLPLLDSGIIHTDQAKLFENDPSIKEHMQFMLWTGLIRCFIDAVYFYFNEDNIRTP